MKMIVKRHTHSIKPTLGLLMLGLATALLSCGVASAEESPRLPGAGHENSATAAASQGSHQVLSKDQVLVRLKEMQNYETEAIQQLEDSIKKHLQDSTTISLKENTSIASNRILTLTNQMAEIDKKRSELIARRGLIDQLVLAVDSKWNGQPLASFFESQLLDMAASDLTNPQGSSATWRFVTYLSIALREIPERHDDVIGVLQSYMDFSSVLTPRTPADFLAQRNYLSLGLSEAANPVTKEVAGDAAEIGAPSHGKTSKPFTSLELRMRPPYSEAAPERPAPRTASNKHGKKLAPVIESRLPIESDPQLPDGPYISPSLRSATE